MRWHFNQKQSVTSIHTYSFLTNTDNVQFCYEHVVQGYQDNPLHNTTFTMNGMKLCIYTLKQTLFTIKPNLCHNVLTDALSSINYVDSIYYLPPLGRWHKSEVHSFHAG